MARKRTKTSTKDREATQAPPPAVTSVSVSAAATTATLRPLVVDERAVLLLLGLGATVAVLSAISAVLLPLLFVAVATFVGAPFVARLERRGISRAIGSGVVVVGVILIVLGLLALVVPALVRDLIALFERAPAALAALAARVETTFGVTIPTSVRDLSGLAASELVE